MGHLYHYTTGAGLLGMLNNYSKDNPNLTMWATHYMYMNDPSEYEIGKKICIDLIDEIESELGISDEYKIKKLIQSPEYQKELNRYLRTSEGQALCPYIISFSRSRDSLHMWDMYASNGNGLAIVFDELKFSESIISREKKYQTNLKDCIYHDEEIPVSAHLKQNIKELYLELNKDNPLDQAMSFAKAGNFMALYSRLHYIYMLLSGFIGIRIKDKAYYLEDEVRISLNKPNYKILFRTRNGIIIPYVEYPIHLSCIENIIVGPTADFNRVKESILILLNSKGIKWDDNRILKSKVPYRL